MEKIWNNNININVSLIENQVDVAFLLEGLSWCNLSVNQLILLYIMICRYWLDLREERMESVG